MSSLLPLVEFPVHFIVAIPVGDTVAQAVLLEWHPHQSCPLPLTGPSPTAHHITALPQRTGVYVCRATLFVPPAVAARNGSLSHEDLDSGDYELRVEEHRALWLPHGVRRADPTLLMQEIAFSTIFPTHP
ncbi:MAG: hypothetical protein KDD73_11555 [Anaerolineales bacterium]|nr:hypothetical protein [Anaerolineales bacterium]